MKGVRITLSVGDSLLRGGGGGETMEDVEVNILAGKFEKVAKRIGRLL